MTGTRRLSSRHRVTTGLLCTATTLTSGLTAAPGWASDSAEDANGVYGRFAGDLDVGFGLGAELSATGAWGASRWSAHYYSMIGVFAGYCDGLGGPAAPIRTVSVGSDLRPAFVPRWASDLEQGPGWLDLAADSISLGLGAFWAQPEGATLGAQRGLEGSLGLGLPLFASAEGLWLQIRATLRWPEGSDATDRAVRPSLMLSLDWHQLLTTGLSTWAEGG